MKMKNLLWGLLLLGACATGPGGPVEDELIVCGGDEVFGVETSGLGAPRKIWSWRPKDDASLPELLRRQFETTDECKPGPDGRILVTSSGGGVALYQRSAGHAIFWASAVNAHSAELLPANKVVVASSTGDGGNRLVLFDLDTPGKLIASEELQGAHGVVWDEEERLLWALGEIELRSYHLVDLGTATPSFALKKAYVLPNPGGHDLRAVPKSESLSVTTGNHVWLFDRRHLNFTPCGGLSNLPGVKCVDVHPRTGRLVYMQADTSWWSERIHFRNPDGEEGFPGLKLYKARWAVLAD
jgi:hypothetical protein